MKILKKFFKKIKNRNFIKKNKRICRKYNLIYKEGVRISKDIKIADNTKIVLSEGCWISHHCSFWGGGTVILGKNTHIGAFSSIYSSQKGGVIIGDDVNCARNLFVIDTNHCYKDRNKLIRLQGLESEKVNIGNNVWIGANVTIIKGASIGDGCVVGACSLVNKKIDNNNVICGVPAKVIKAR